MKLSRDLFDYKSVNEWGPRLKAEAGDLLSERCISLLRKRLNRDDFSGDIKDWFDVAVRQELGVEGASRILVEKLKSRHGSIRLYHGTRPEDLGPYFSNGILSGSVARVEALARKTFGDGQFADVTEADLDQAMEGLRDQVRHQEKRVYLVVDDRIFVRNSHYPLYGSEYLLWVIAKLPEKCGPSSIFYEHLRRRGVPTIIEVDLPLDHLPPSTASLWDEAVTQYLWHLAEGTEWWDLDYSVNIPHVRPDFISGHYHPATLVDLHADDPGPHASPTECSHCLKKT